MSNSPRLWLVGMAVVGCVAAVPALSARAAPARLANGKIVATFDRQGLVGIKDTALGRNIAFQGDTFAIGIDGRILSSKKLDNPAVGVHHGGGRILNSHGQINEKADLPNLFLLSTR